MTPKRDITGSYAIRGIGLGILYMVVALIGQQFVQSMPAIIFLFYHRFDVSSLSTFMKWGRLIDKGKLALLLSILIHSIVDGGLVYADYYINFHPSLYYISVYEYWSMVMVISAGIFITGTLLLRSVEDIEIPPEPVVY